VKFTAKTPTPIKAIIEEGAQTRKDLRASAISATDRAGREAQREVQAKIRNVGLGRLDRAVGFTSFKVEGGRAADDPYGVIFARGGDESQGGGTLEAYSKGANIVPGAGKQWLAIATRAVPKFVSLGGRRFRTTPQLYKNSGLNTSIGQLVFKPIGPNKAVLVIKKVTLSPKTGRAKAAGPGRTRTRIPQKEVIAFVLIRVTRRAQRFDKDAVVRMVAGRVPRYMQEALEQIRNKRGAR
jgi:hypothetical protein